MLDWWRAAVSLPPIFGPGICGRLGASGCQSAGRQHGADGAQPCRRDTWGNRGHWEHLGKTFQWINRGFLHENQPMVDDNELENRTVELAPLVRSNGLFIWPTKRGYETGIRFVFFYIIRWYDGRIGDLTNCDTDTVVSNMFHRSVDEPLWRVYSFCFTQKRLNNQQLWGTQPTTMECNGM